MGPAEQYMSIGGQEAHSVTMGLQELVCLPFSHAVLVPHLSTLACDLRIISFPGDPTKAGTERSHILLPWGLHCTSISDLPHLNVGELRTNQDCVRGVELSVTVAAIHSVLPDMAGTSHTWLLGMRDVVSVSEELSFSYFFFKS